LDSYGVERLKTLKKELAKYKPKKIFLDTTCVICLIEFNNVNSNKNYIVKFFLLFNSSSDVKIDKATDLHCGHRFHDDCIKDRLKTEKTCPICRCKDDI